jgi:hypothetical protein
MQDRIIKTVRGALLPAVAILGLFAAIPAAQAEYEQADQQATPAEIDNAQNWAAASGTGMSDAHAEYVRPFAHHLRYR